MLHEKRSALKLGQAHLLHCHRFQIALPIVPPVVVALTRTTTAIARTGARAHAGNLALAKATLSLQQASVTSRQHCKRCSPSSAWKTCQRAKVTCELGAYVCVRADVPTVGVLQTQVSRGRELPLSGVHLAASSARLCSAGAQPFLGRGDLDASRAQASAQDRLRGA